MISIVSNNMIRFNIKSIANYLLFPKNEVHYIGGAEILPAPLSSEEETLLLTHLDDDVLEARQTLIEHNLRLVVYIAKKFDNKGVGVEDLISIGTIGLIKAINTFKSDKNIKLATYASRCIENEILMHLRRNSRIKTEVSIDEPLNVDWDGNELLLSDILGTEEDLVYKDIEDEKEYLTTIDRFDEIFDVSVVDFPAYDDTSIMARSGDDTAYYRKLDEQRLREKRRRLMLMSMS